MFSNQFEKRFQTIRPFDTKKSGSTQKRFPFVPANDTFFRKELLMKENNPIFPRRAGKRHVLKINDCEYRFRWCPPGRFMMGSPPNETERWKDETFHPVTLTCGFWMLETPVTQIMWTRIMESNPSLFKGSCQLPVEMVSWDDCQNYIQKLNDMKVAPNGYRFSLPTEAQWEYACRAGTTTPYFFGSMFDEEWVPHGNTPYRICENETKEVGFYPANAWGLHDMHGNVPEWCLDWYGLYPSSGVTDPAGLSSGEYHVARGGISCVFDGCLNAPACWTRSSASRTTIARSDHGQYVGVRLILVEG